MKARTAAAQNFIDHRQNLDTFTIDKALVVGTTSTLTGATTQTGLLTCAGGITATGASSDIKRTGANGQYLAIKQATVQLNMATATGTGTGTITATGLIPAGSIVLGVTAHISTIIAGATIATWSLGITSHTTYFGTGLALAAGTDVDVTDFTITGPVYCTGATDVLMTADAGSFSTGVVRLTVHYITLSAATS